MDWFNQFNFLNEFIRKVEINNSLFIGVLWLLIKSLKRNL